MSENLCDSCKNINSCILPKNVKVLRCTHYSICPAIEYANGININESKLDEGLLFVENPRIMTLEECANENITPKTENRSSHQFFENKKTGGNGNKYYDLPKDATQLQDLIEFKNMNGNIKDIFKGCYRLGEKQDTETIYDIEKIAYYALRELGRLKGTRDFVSLAEKLMGNQNKGEK